MFYSLVFLGSLVGNVDILSPADRVLLSGLPGLAGRKRRRHGDSGHVSPDAERHHGLPGEPGRSRHQHPAPLHVGSSGAGHLRTETLPARRLLVQVQRIRTEWVGTRNNFSQSSYVALVKRRAERWGGGCYGIMSPVFLHKAESLRTQMDPSNFFHDQINLVSSPVGCCLRTSFNCFSTWTVFTWIL